MKTMHTMTMPAICRLVACLILMTCAVMAQEYDEDREITPAAMFAFLNQHLPVLAEELELMREEEPDEYREALDESLDFVAYLQELKAESPRAFDAVIQAELLEYRGWAIAHEIGATEDPARQAELRDTLQQLLEQVFDARMIEREAEIEAMTAELDEIKGIMEQRRNRKALIVSRQLESMVEEVDESLEWW